MYKKMGYKYKKYVNLLACIKRESGVLFTELWQWYFMYLVQSSFFLSGALKTFSSKPRIPGVCYATELIALGRFDRRGGMLKLLGEANITLRIPPGAVQELQLIYMALQYESHDFEDPSETISPVFDCGPDGSQFQVM